MSNIMQLVRQLTYSLFSWPSESKCHKQCFSSFLSCSVMNVLTRSDSPQAPSQLTTLALQCSCPVLLKHWPLFCVPDIRRPSCGLGHCSHGMILRKELRRSLLGVTQGQDPQVKCILPPALLKNNWCMESCT